MPDKSEQERREQGLRKDLGKEIGKDRAALPPRLWNAGNSLLGLACALGGRRFWRSREKVLEVAGGWLIRLLVRRGWAQAITLGDVVLYADAALIPIIHYHEMVHVRQGRLWGPFFLPAYVLESLWQYARTRDGYHNNRFEVAAYRQDAARNAAQDAAKQEK